MAEYNCQLKCYKENPFMLAENGHYYPSIEVYLFERGMDQSIVINALLDTGSEYPLIIVDEDIVNEMEKYINKIREDNIEWGTNVPCDVYSVKLNIHKNWYKSEFWFPKYGIHENIIGRPIIEKSTLCIRWSENNIVLAE